MSPKSSIKTKTAPVRGICQDCLWWEPRGGGAVGDCRIYPPTRGSQPWPQTRYNDMCSRFEPLPSEAQEPTP